MKTPAMPMIERVLFSEEEIQARVKEVAAELNVSATTVQTYLRRIYEKLQVRTRTEAVAKFLRR